MNTGFIRLFQNETTDFDLKTSQSLYDEFALYVFSEKEKFISKDAYHNALVYTRVELFDIMTYFEKKKKLNLFKKR